MANIQHQRGVAEKVYFDAEAKDLLASTSVNLGLHKSKIVCALIRLAAGGKPRPGEERVAEQLKRVFGREQFLAFLGAVRAALPDYAEPLPCPTKPDGEPEAWKLPFGVGVLAFYAPTEANVGLLFSRASTLKRERSLARVLVVTTNSDTVPADTRADLAAAGIVVVSLADLPRELAKLARKPRQGKGVAGR